MYNKKRRWVLLVTTLVVVVSGVGAWWFHAASPESQAEIIPKQVCQGYFSGEKVAKYMPGSSGKFSDDSTGFPKSGVSGPGSSCELSRGTQDLSVRAQYRYDGSIQGARKEKGPFVTLGKAYGYYSHLGTLLLHVPCPTNSSPERTLLLVSGSSAADGSGSKKGVNELAEFSSYSGRILARKAFNCQGAQSLPEGRVTFED